GSSFCVTACLPSLHAGSHPSPLPSPTVHCLLRDTPPAWCHPLSLHDALPISGVGAVVTQASTNPRLGHLGLNLLRAGYSAPRVLEEIAASDQFVERRQLGCLDVTGLAAARTGSGNRPWAGHRVDRNVVVTTNASVR